jgi:hypothetical protein
VLTTLADDVASQAHEGRLAVSLRVRSQVQEFVSPGSD